MSVGFGYRPSAHAPDTFETLSTEYRSCTCSGLPLRVSSLFCEHVIFEVSRENHALRFWHDTNHVQLRMDFSANGEMEVACYQLEALRAAGFASNSLEHRLLHADSIGQNFCLAVIGRYPIDQLQFDVWCVTDGVDEAIAYEFAKGGEAA